MLQDANFFTQVGAVFGYLSNASCDGDMRKHAMPFRGGSRLKTVEQLN